MAMPTGYLTDPFTQTTTQYMELLEGFGSLNGSHSEHQKRKRVAILGGGISGLLTGFLLQHIGHDVHIYEASNTVGGRIKTLRDRFTAGYYAEAGAMRIPSHHTLALNLAETLDLPCLEFPRECQNGNTVYFINNHHFTLKAYEATRPNFGFQLEESERGRKADELLDDAIIRHLRDKEAAGGWSGITYEKLNDPDKWQETERVLKYFDGFSLYDFLRDIARIGRSSVNDTASVKLSAEGANYICSLLALEMSMASSMAHVLDMNRTLFHAKKLYQIIDGMDWLPKAFIGLNPPTVAEPQEQLIRPGTAIEWLRAAKPNMSRNVTYNTRVTEIGFDRRGDERTFMLYVASENTVLRHERRDYYDLIVSALPFSSLRHVRMKWLAGVNKRRALRQLHYDNACKVLLEFKTPFWAENSFGISGGKTITDLPIRQTFYSHPAQNKNNVLLASYTWGDDSLRWTGLRPDDRLRFALRDLAYVHQIKLEELERSFVGGVSHSWAEHEFTSGAFAVFEPHQYNDLFPHIWNAEGRVHYCGEHTSTKHGWIEGAVESAIRVVKEIYDRVEAFPRLNDSLLPSEFMHRLVD